MATIKSYTSLEQSKKLAEILPLESADMHYINDKHCGCVSYNEMINSNNPWLKGVKISPCWSLAALLEVLHFPSLHRTISGWRCDIYNDAGGSFILSKDMDNPVDACVETILKFKEKNLL